MAQGHVGGRVPPNGIRRLQEREPIFARENDLHQHESERKI